MIYDDDIYRYQLDDCKETILQQTCYHQDGASNVNTSWYQLDDCKETILQQTCYHQPGATM